MSFVITPKTISRAFAALLVLAGTGYFLYRLSPVLQAPQVVLSSPAADLVVREREYVITGRTTNAFRLTVNHEDVYLDGGGNFSVPIYLSSGVNTIEIRAEGRFGRETAVIRHIVLEKNKNNP